MSDSENAPQKYPEYPTLKEMRANAEKTDFFDRYAQLRRTRTKEIEALVDEENRKEARDWAEIKNKPVGGDCGMYNPQRSICYKKSGGLLTQQQI